MSSQASTFKALDFLAKELVALEDDLGADSEYVTGFRDAMDTLRDALKRAQNRHAPKACSRNDFLKLIWGHCHQQGQQKAFGLHMTDNDTYVWDTDNHYYRLHFSDDAHAELIGMSKATGAVMLHKYATRALSGHGSWGVTWENAPDSLFDLKNLARAVKENA